VADSNFPSFVDLTTLGFVLRVNPGPLVRLTQGGVLIFGSAVDAIPNFVVLPAAADLPR
jgi:hypothetical protein